MSYRFTYPSTRYPRVICIYLNSDKQTPEFHQQPSDFPSSFVPAFVPADTCVCIYAKSYIS